MKKVLSIFIALLLVISLFATTAVAFAEGETDETKYSVTYAAGEHGTGDAPAEASYVAGTKVKLAAAYTFTATDGYEFAGWKVSSIDDKTFEAGEEFTMPAQNVTVTAQWTEPRGPVKVNATELAKNLALGCDWFNNLKIEMGDVKFGAEMMKDAALVEAAFPGIIYYTEDTDDHKKSDSDVIYVEYCRPSESPKGQTTWQNSAKITDNIRISSSGWYLFRFVVKNKAGKVLAISNSEYTTDTTDFYLNYYAEDTRRPVVALSTTMKSKQDSGLTAGVKYSIPTSGLTSGSTDEMSSTTVTFKIYKRVNGNWTADPIYDSTTKEVAEGYEDFVDKDGAITPSENDISKNDEAIYKVVYTVTDAYGFTGVESSDDWEHYDPALKFEPEMLLKVVAAPAEKKNSVNVWEIILFCIAGLSAVGIVVLLCIKPKEAAPAGKPNAVAKDDEPAETTDETQE